MWEGKQLGPFLIEKEIGAGAMGTVYRATYTKISADVLGRHLETKKRVAIKVVSVDLQKNPKALARFERETIILKKLDHPHIVKLYASGHAGNRPFYAMEFIDGETLESVLHRRGRHTWEEVIRLGQQICAALHHAHQQGVIHRDLKPANIMIARDGTVKLTDFGIAKGLDLDQLTATNCAIGTASYMSPEQCRGEKNLSHKSDLYSLGVLLYELMVGKRPFQAENTLDMYLMHVEGKFERPSRHVLDIPIWLDTLVCQLLEKDPAKRPFDAATVAQALGNIQDKIEARRSAGVDVVTGKASEKPRTDFTMDGADAEAARTLKAAVNKKKRKKQPLFSSVWFQAVGYLAILAALGGMVWWFTRPPAADELYTAAKKLMATTDPDKHQEARSGPIEKYFKYYGDRTDAQALDMQNWADSADLALKKRQLRNRMKRGLTPNSDPETRAMSAVRREDAGDLSGAKEEWLALEKYKSTKDPDLRPWGLLAADNLFELKKVQERSEAVTAIAYAAEHTGQPYKTTSEPEKRAALAEHYGLFKDYGTALKRWRKLREQYETEPDERLWFLLAASKVKEIEANPQRESSEAVVKRALKEAEELAPQNPAAALVKCVDVITLYRDDSEMAKYVTAAEDLSQKLVAAKKD